MHGISARLENYELVTDRSVEDWVYYTIYDEILIFSNKIDLKLDVIGMARYSRDI